MKTPLIKQIAVGTDGDSSSIESTLHGLDNDGNVWVWGRKKLEEDKKPTEGYNPPKYRYGWILLEDNLNEPRQ